LKNRWQKLFSLKDNSGKPISRKMKYSIGVVLLGLVLLLAGNVFSAKQAGQDPGQAETTMNFAEQETAARAKDQEKKPKELSELEAGYEQSLTGMLEKIKGISDVEVMVNLDSTQTQVYEKNLVSGQQTTDETDTNGGARTIEDRTEETQTVLVRQGDQEVPLLIHTKKPKVRGVFIIAKGADHAEAKQWIVESVSRVLDVPTHRVSVIPKK